MATPIANTESETATSTPALNLVPVKYDLMQVDSYAVLVHISRLTGSAKTNISPDFLLNLCTILNDRYNKGKATIFGYLLAPNDKEIIRKVIGTDGYYFKRTTTTSGADFIWHDHENGLFLFWGASNFRTVKAMNAIRWRINKFEGLVSPLKQVETPVKSGDGDGDGDGEDDSDTDYSDMPPLVCE